MKRSVDDARELLAVGKLSDMLRHLIRCPHVGVTIQDDARRKHADRKRKLPHKGNDAQENRPLQNQPVPSATEAELPSKRPRLDGPPGSSESFYGESLAPSSSWSDEQQAAFAAHLCRLLIACNAAWWSVDHPYVRWFFNNYILGALVPGRKTISGKVLNDEARRLESVMESEVTGSTLR